MAKRKRGSATSPTPRKATKRAATRAPEAQPSSSAPLPHLHGDVDPEKEYKLRAIIGEKPGYYQIDWENDSETGDQYPPTWEPKKNANKLAVADWERKKAANKKPARGKARAKPAASNKQPQLSPATAPARRPRGRPRKSVVVESSPDPLSAKPVDSNGTGTGTGDVDLEIGESQQSPAGSTLFVPEESVRSASGTQSPQLQAWHREPTVQVPDPPSSYDRGAYHRVHHQSSSNESVSGFVESSQPLPVPVLSTLQEADENTTRVVPDSQSQGYLFEESTFRGFSPTPQNPEGINTSVVKQSGPESTAEPTNTAPAKFPVPNHPDNAGDDDQALGGAEQDEATAEALQAVITDQTLPPVQVAPEELRHSAEPYIDSQEEHLSAAAQEVPNQPLQSAESRIDLNEELLPAAVQAVPDLSLQSTEPYVESQEESPSPSPAAAARSPEASNQTQATTDQVELNQTQASTDQVEDYIVISAEEEDISSLGLLTQADYNPPPAAQRPPPSSLLESPSIVQRKNTEELLDTDSPTHQAVARSTRFTQSSFPFQTQHPTKIEHEQRHSRALFSPYPSPSALRSSSQIPSVPSQSIGTIGESAPARLRTPSVSTANATMEPSNADNPLLAHLLAMSESGKAKRRARRSNTPTTNPTPRPLPASASAIPANVSADVTASQAGARSPSAVPASHPEPSITKEEMRTSGRLPTLVNGSEDGHGGSIEESMLTVSEPSRTQDGPETANIHVVPVSFGNIQRDQYTMGFQWYEGKKEIQGFLDGENSPEGFSKAEAALDELRQIAMHLDLINSEASQPLSTPEQAQWDVDASGKFRFLRDLLEQLRSLNVHVVVAAAGNRIPEMLGSFLQGSGVPYVRLCTRSEPEAHHEGFGISILDLDSDVAVEQLTRADIVVAMDGTCSHQDRLIRAARRADRDNDWAILLVLVAPCTVEHIERSLLTSITDATRVRTLLKTALKLQLQGVAGRLTPGQSSSKEAAVEAAGFLASSSPMDWPIEELGTIDNIDSQTDTDLNTTLHEDSSFSAGKRSLEVDGETSTGSSGKRPRVSSTEAEIEVEGNAAGTSQPVATINPQDIELTHISDSLGKPATQSALDDFGSLSEVEQLRHILDQKHDELEEHVKAMSELQFRHEDQHVQLANTKKERNEAIITAQTAVSRMTIAANQSAELRTERAELKQQLEEANAKLLSHTIPEISEFNALRSAMEEARLAKEKAEKRLEQAQKDNEYSREMYQNASSRARELTQENADLEARLEIAENLASGEQAKAQTASNIGHDKLLARENKRLKALLKDRETGMKFKDEEIARLKEAGRGRNTRGSSVPRSPRMGSPALKGRTSRQASPSTGDLRGKHLHPLRQG